MHTDNNEVKTYIRYIKRRKHDHAYKQSTLCYIYLMNLNTHVYRITRRMCTTISQSSFFLSLPRDMNVTISTKLFTKRPPVPRLRQELCLVYLKPCLCFKIELPINTFLFFDNHRTIVLHYCILVIICLLCYEMI